MRKVIHLRSRYLGATFLHYIISSLPSPQKNIHVLSIAADDLKRFPTSDLKTLGGFCAVLRALNKVLRKIRKIDYDVINVRYLHFFKLRVQSFDILHAHMGYEGAYAVGLKKLLGKKLVTTFYGDDVSVRFLNNGFWKRSYKNLFSNADALIVEGPEMKKKLICLGAPSEAIWIVPIPIPVECHFKKVIETKTDRIRILMCATFTEKKGYIDALNALAILKSSNIGFECIIVGEGAQKRKIQDTIRHFDLSDCVKLYGRLEMERVYVLAMKSDIFLHPSKEAADGDSEGGAPTIVLQMMSVGLPVISTFHADIPNVTANTSLLVKESDPVQLSEKILEVAIMYRNDIDRLVEITEQNKKFVLSQHTQDNVSKKLQYIYSVI